MKQAFLVAIVMVLAACSQTFENVRLGMSKQETIQSAGSPDSVIAAYDEDGKIIEVLEYRRGGLWWGDLEGPTWFYFTNDKLERWGRPDDRLRYVGTDAWQ